MKRPPTKVLGIKSEVYCTSYFYVILTKCLIEASEKRKDLFEKVQSIKSGSSGLACGNLVWLFMSHQRQKVESSS